MRPADLLLLDNRPTIWTSIRCLARGLAAAPACDRARHLARPRFLDRIRETTWHIADRAIRRVQATTAHSRRRGSNSRSSGRRGPPLRAHRSAPAELLDRFRAKRERLEGAEPTEDARPADRDRAGACAAGMALRVPRPLKLPEQMLDAEDIALGYGDGGTRRGKFQGALGDHIGILGVNGAGKSTLVKSIAGDLLRTPGAASRCRSGDRLLRAASARSIARR